MRVSLKRLRTTKIKGADYVSKNSYDHITNELLTKYGAYMDKNISQVTLIQDDEIVELEIFWDERTPNKKSKTTIKRTDLSFIVDDPRYLRNQYFL